VKGLNREIDELYQFARLLEDEKERKQMKLISWIGAILLVPTLIAALFGMNTINNGYLNVCKWPVDSNFLQSLWIIVVLTVFIFAVVFLFHLIIKTFRKHNKSK
jgi:Mg2+ and Co2+ transporter CorA